MIAFTLFQNGKKRRWLLSVLICGKISAWEICPHPPAWRQPVEITRPTNMIHFMAFVVRTLVRDRWQRQTLFFFSIIIFRLEQEEKSKSDLNKGEKSEPHLTKKMTRYSCLVFGHSLIFEQPHQSKNLGTVCVFRTAWECNQGVWSNLLLGLFSCSFSVGNETLCLVTASLALSLVSHLG